MAKESKETKTRETSVKSSGLHKWAEYSFSKGNIFFTIIAFFILPMAVIALYVGLATGSISHEIGTYSRMPALRNFLLNLSTSFQNFRFEIPTINTGFIASIGENVTGGGIGFIVDVIKLLLNFVLGIVNLAIVLVNCIITVVEFTLALVKSCALLVNDLISGFANGTFIHEWQPTNIDINEVVSSSGVLA